MDTQNNHKEDVKICLCLVAEIKMNKNIKKNLKEWELILYTLMDLHLL